MAAANPYPSAGVKVFEEAPDLLDEKLVAPIGALQMLEPFQYPQSPLPV
jgi:hypothetical protein